ncbi:DUF3791 domain-containing protein [Prevotella sp. AGR2160]|uniref:DUF3791 domain-containing protein n=1 Tax=Prevotella sp. AGR2160 TaxID=1280674 RepID=UPI00048FCA3C|nr:DUF3791 domain-containing protein [Prevotella sp. AGR2160]
MEIYSDTIDDRKIRFAVIAIEAAAKKLGISPSTFCARLDHYDLIEKRLFKYYDTLHTQSQSYVADDIIETLRNYERREGGKE